MPYITTTSEPFNAAEHVHRNAFTRRAVATLDEARAVAWRACRGEWDAYVQVARQTQAMALPESGGTIGPLPDGTVIEVRRMTREDVTSTAGEARYIAGMTEAQMVEAFNAT